MPYNSYISRTDATALIPEDASREILKSVAASNPLLQLARRLPDLPRKTRRLPVMSSLATAYFVDGDTGLKQSTDVTWDNKYIDAEEVAAIIPIPEAVLDDSDFDIWSEVRPELVQALNAAINAAILFGTNIPSTWTTNLGAAGLLAKIVAASHTVDQSTQVTAGEDVYDTLLGSAGVISLIEADGFMATGHLGALSMRGLLRGVRSKELSGGTVAYNIGMPIFTRSMQDANQYDLDGSPIFFPTDGVITGGAGNALLFSGQWDQLVWAMRQDVTYKVLTEAVIQDAGGAILYNLAQQDMVALRVVMRLGVALPNPINRVNSSSTTRLAFAALVP